MVSKAKPTIVVVTGEIDTTNNLFRHTVVVYLQKNGEEVFNQFVLHYDMTTEIVSISVYSNITQSMHAQLIKPLPSAKKKLDTC